MPDTRSDRYQVETALEIGYHVKASGSQRPRRKSCREGGDDLGPSAIFVQERPLPCGGNNVVLAEGIKITTQVDDFSPDNDPYGEYDFGNFDLFSRKFFWKIDYYNPACECGSEDPASGQDDACAHADVGERILRRNLLPPSGSLP
jgi:Protein of unknown function (DUF3768)